MATRTLVLDDVQPLFTQQCQVVQHPSQYFWGVALPALHLTDGSHWMAGAIPADGLSTRELAGADSDSPPGA